MVVLSVKFTILISWSPICICLIFLSALMKLATTASTILYNSMESRHPWRINIRVKESDRRSFILILDSIFVYAALSMWINLSPYPNLRKVEKIKTTLRILEKYFYSVHLTHPLCTKSRKSLYSKVILFLISCDWCSPIIVCKCFLHSIRKN